MARARSRGRKLAPLVTAPGPTSPSPQASPASHNPTLAPKSPYALGGAGGPPPAPASLAASAAATKKTTLALLAQPAVPVAPPASADDMPVAEVRPLMRWPEAAVLAAVCAPALYIASTIPSPEVRAGLAAAGLAGVAALAATVAAVPAASAYLLRRGLWGRDLGKKGSPASFVKIPSAVGLLCGTIFMIAIILANLWPTKHDLTQLATYNAALMSVCFMTLLGFADDVLDLPWRYKLLLPTIGSLPLLSTYSGHTTVLLPAFARPALWSAATGELTWLGSAINALGGPTFGLTVDPAGMGALVNLGVLYFVYMGLLAVFATNAINIYAGLNGLEAGQSLVIGVAILTANVWELSTGVDAASPHLFAASLVLPFMGVTIGVLAFNLYPARVFVGDTYCYFAGMTFAVMAILGHFSKTLLLFFVPQIINFLYSLPQLFKVYECPRHRMPEYDLASDTVRPSTFVAARNAAGAPVKVRDNLTVINWVLRLAGPLNERAAVGLLLALQVAACGAGLAVRYWMSPWLYPGSGTDAGSTA